MECKCLFLDGKDVNITIKKDATGADLFASVCKYLAIENTQPFGLVHRGGSNPPTYNWWVRLDKEIRKQVHGKCKIWSFALVLKFYPMPPKMEISEDIVRFFSVLQVRQDLLTEKLTCTARTLSLLASYWLQSEYGEFTSGQVDRQLAEEFRYVTKGKYTVDIDFEEQMIELHRCHKNMPPADADDHFIRLAASLSTYGVHFYPTFELASKPDNSRFWGSTTRIQDCGDQLLLGVGPRGVVMLKEKKSRKELDWNNIRSVSFKRNRVIIQLQKRDKEGRIQLSFVMESTNQAKVVWKAAVDIHVNYRFRKNIPAAVKIQRDFGWVGVKKVKIIPKTNSRVSKKPHISVISEVPTDKTSSPTLPKRLFDPDSTTAPKLPPSPSMRSQTATKKTDSPRSANSSPTLADRRSKPSTPSADRKSSPKPQEDDPTDTPTLRYDDKVAFSIPRRIRQRIPEKASSENWKFDDDISAVSDNTDMLCSKGIIEKAFSYAEGDGVNSINSWLELCSPKTGRRGRERTRRNWKLGRENTSSPSASQRSRSRERSPIDLIVDDVHDYKPLIPSKRPIVIRATELRDLSPPHTVHYEDEPVRRRPDRYKSAENVSRRATIYPRKVPLTDRDSSYKKLADIYRQEYLNNVKESETMERRSKSMYSLPQKRAEYGDRDIYGPIDYYRGISPSSISAVASSGSRRSCDSYLLASNMEERDLFGRDHLPVESSFTRRVLSESRLARQRELSGSINPADVDTIIRNRTPVARTRRRNVTSWAYGDGHERGSVLSRSLHDVRQRKLIIDDTIPRIPKFITSVR